MVATNNIKGGQIISADLEPLAFIIFDPLQGITRMTIVFSILIPGPSVFSFLYTAHCASQEVALMDTDGVIQLLHGHSLAII